MNEQLSASTAYSEYCRKWVVNENDRHRRLFIEGWNQGRATLETENVKLRKMIRDLSEIETAINRLSPPNFKGTGEAVSLVEKVQWLIDRYNRADRYAKANPVNKVISEK